MEMVIMLGPATVVVLMLAPFLKGMERNVESLRDAHSRMRVLAERDALTNLYNRRAGERLVKALMDAGDWSNGVIMFDIDRFKSINDTHGHAVGDKVLRRVVKRCAPRLRQDDIFSRWGGEEFLVLIRGATRDVLVLIAEDLRKAISRAPMDSAGTVTASFGVTPFRDGDTLESLLRRADQALYAAKKGGRNQVADR